MLRYRSLAPTCLPGRARAPQKSEVWGRESSRAFALVALCAALAACTSEADTNPFGAGGGTAMGSGAASAGGAPVGSSRGGAGATGGSAPATPTICDASLEGETMMASTGELVEGGWNIYTTGTLSGAHDFKGGPTTLTVMARGSVAGGEWPHMVVRVGETQVGEADVMASTWMAYSFTFEPNGVGPSPIEIEFTNDSNGGTEDRNLYIDKLGISENCSGQPGPSGAGGGGGGAGGGGNISSNNPFAGVTLHLDSGLKAVGAEQSLRSSGKTADADLMKKIATSAQADWIVGQGDPTNAVRGALDAAGDKLRVLVAYNIYNRDCGSESAGGANDAAAYKRWIDGFANGIGERRTAIILEPDTLASDCDHTRWDSLNYAVTALKKHAGAHVYIDAGHANWVPAGTMAGRLATAGIANADGFALNVSSFQTTSASINYGTSLSGQVGNKPFVIDTSRNGKGPASDAAWCNPAGRGLGEKPTASTGNPLVHALLWIKRPGESDGACNGGPPAGQWFQDYALALAKNAIF